ncbi:MAG: energy transducer TonB [Deltaproteobacteria bacterium]|nr:energy transducer TonB [Deltaproteobacteria bacterium]
MCVMFVLSRQWDARPSVNDAANAAVDVEVVPLTKEQMDKLKGQIVESSPAKKTDETPKTKYLSQQNQVVERETRAANTAPFKEAKIGGQSGKVQAQQQPKDLALGHLGVKMDYKPMGNLGPGAMASTSDYLKDTQQGAQTLLNTREYAYFSFYQRVRKQLEQYWEPGLRERLRTMFDRGRRLAAEQEHSTKLTVVMAKDGTITRILVDGTSGMLDLDQAAIDAFNKAGPFPNPPQGLMDAEGTVKIEWEFVLKT